MADETRTTLEFTLTEEQVEAGVLRKLQDYARKIGATAYATDSYEFDPDDPMPHIRPR